jgi:serine protease DegQ
MLYRLWIVFAQCCTAALAIFFVVTSLRPDWVRIPFISDKKPPDAVATSPPAPVVLAPAPTQSVQAVTSYADAVKRALPGVVSIQTSRVDRRNHPLADDPFFQRFFGNRGTAQRQVMGEGSGAIVSAKGHVLTNFHVVQGASEIEVMTGDARRLKAKVLGVDPESDLAVLKVDAENLPAIPLGDSNALQVGDVVLAMGNPYGISNTVTMGIVSALARRGVSETNPWEDFIQTDAAINPGNSGGPLVNTAGQLVGINTAIYTRTGSTTGIGFSIPSALVKNTMEQIIATGTVSRGYLGVSMGDINERVIQEFALQKNVRGAFVIAVVNDGPGARAGLQLEDVIIEINGKPVADQTETIAAISATQPGATIPVKVNRRGTTVELSVTIGKRAPLQLASPRN